MSVEKRIHLEFDPNLGRYRSEATCLNVPLWEAGDSFVVREGLYDVILYVFSSESATESSIVRDLGQRMYEIPVAAGRIRHDEQEWRFQRPPSRSACMHLLDWLVRNDGQFVRYFGRLLAVAPDGMPLARIHDLLVGRS